LVGIGERDLSREGLHRHGRLVVHREPVQGHPRRDVGRHDPQSDPLQPRHLQQARQLPRHALTRPRPRPQPRLSHHEPQPPTLTLQRRPRPVAGPRSSRILRRPQQPRNHHRLKRPHPPSPTRQLHTRTGPERHPGITTTRSRQRIRLTHQPHKPLNLGTVQLQRPKQPGHHLRARDPPPRLHPRHRRLRHPSPRSQPHTRQPGSQPQPPQLLTDLSQPLLTHNRAFYHPTPTHTPTTTTPATSPRKPAR